MNLNYCRVCQGHKYVSHSTFASLPIHLWPLESVGDHLLEDAGLYICQECGHVQLQTLDDVFIASLYSEGSCVEDDLGMKKERLKIIRYLFIFNFQSRRDILPYIIIYNI